MGEESGVGDREGNEVRLLVSAAGDDARDVDVLDIRFEGRKRTVLLLRLLEAVEVCEELRTRSTAAGVSMAAMSVSRRLKIAHSGCDGRVRRLWVRCGRCEGN